VLQCVVRGGLLSRGTWRRRLLPPVQVLSRFIDCVLQCVAVCCSVLQCKAMCCNVGAVAAGVCGALGSGGNLSTRTVTFVDSVLPCGISDG